jgi:hypothetical protein
MQQQEAPFAYAITPVCSDSSLLDRPDLADLHVYMFQAGRENLCAAAHYLQQASALVQVTINSSSCSSSGFGECFLTF